MTAPRIIPAAVAEELRQVSDTAIEGMTAAGAGERETRAAVLVRDLAASVVALHAEVTRLTALVEDQRWDARDDVRIAGLCERSRIAAWLRRKAMAGITAGLPETPTLLALLSYADAIANNHTED